MKKILVMATHGRFASGIESSINLIIGKQENLISLDCYIEKNFNLEKEIELILSKYIDNEIIFLVDIKGGSIYNKLTEYTNDKIKLVSGLNLPLIFEILENENEDLEILINNTRNQIQLYKQINLEDEDF